MVTKIRESLVGRDSAFAILIGVLVSSLSYWLLHLYTGGDQAGYQAAYRRIEGLDLFSAHYIYERSISGRDLIHFFISWTYSSLGTEKSTVMAIFNGGLVAYLYLLLRRWGLSIPSVMFIVLTNYYIWVVLLAAERLKFAIFFLILSFLNAHKKSLFITFATLSAISHVSILIVYLGVYSVVLANAYTQTESSYKYRDHLLLVATIFLIVILFSWPGIAPKLGTYVQELSKGSFMALLPSMLFLALTIRKLGQYLSPLLAFAPTIAGIMVFGPSRLNMFAVFIFFYYYINAVRRMDVVLTILSLYLCLKTGLLLSNVVVHGEGFP